MFAAQNMVDVTGMSLLFLLKHSVCEMVESETCWRMFVDRDGDDDEARPQPKGWQSKNQATKSFPKINICA